MEGELALGRAAYASKDYAEAIEYFTEVLEDVDCPQDQLHLIHSNRCACYTQLRQYAAALEDAESCTSYKPTWAKGHARRGAVLDATGKLDDAIAAYDKASELEPSNAEYADASARLRLKQEARLAGDRVRKQHASSGRRSYEPPPTPATAKSPRLENLHLILRAILFLNTIRYLTSFNADRAALRARYLTVDRLILICGLTHLYRLHGRPKIKREYMQAVMSDVAVQRCFGAFVLLMGGSVVPVLPLLYLELAATLALVVCKLRSFGSPRARTWALQLVAACEGSLLDGDGAVDRRVLVHAAYGEVAAGALVALELFSPRRNFILTVLYWQYLQMRFMLEAASATYMGSGALHDAFGRVDAALAAAAAHGNCPTAVEQAYLTLRGLVQKQVALPEPGKKPSLKCTIM
ncbi:hypothetical protein M885DRAFT_620223 [Pelagophyceae sp. CCMP2097]|nr:hypothetical protein M885DRAFT_620223 [Pelagophyceae sp. CCMP2097]